MGRPAGGRGRNGGEPEARVIIGDEGARVQAAMPGHASSPGSRAPSGSQALPSDPRNRSRAWPVEGTGRAGDAPFGGVPARRAAAGPGVTLGGEALTAGGVLPDAGCCRDAMPLSAALGKAGTGCPAGCSGFSGALVPCAPAAWAGLAVARSAACSLASSRLPSNGWSAGGASAKIGDRRAASSASRWAWRSSCCSAARRWAVLRRPTPPTSSARLTPVSGEGSAALVAPVTTAPPGVVCRPLPMPCAMLLRTG